MFLTSPVRTPPRLSRWFALLAASAAPLLAQAQNCPTGNNTDGNYILGDISGTASAMNWPTGLVWKRCLEGMAFDSASGQCTGSATFGEWQNWATSYLPKYFTDSGSFQHSAPIDRDFLTSGDWRMAYRSELTSITENCGDSPKVNRTVFPNTKSWLVWSGSPYVGLLDYVWGVSFSNGNANGSHRSSDGDVRLVRAGQSFAALLPPAAQTGTAGATVTFPAFTLAASVTPGQAWGGARIAGDGSPEFQVNGGAWVQEAIVKSTDVITVRLTAPATGGNTATFTLRSGQTTGTDVTGSNGGDEATAMVERQTTFTANAAPVAGACGSAHGVAVLAAPAANLCSAGVAGSVSSTAAAFAWNCAGTDGGSSAACSAPRQYSVTPLAGAGGSISPSTAQAVTYNASTSFTVTPSSGYGIASVSGCGGSLAGSTYTTGAVTANCTVNASFSPLPPSTHSISVAASPAGSGSVACNPNPVPHGSNASCTATANTGYRFTGWTGSCSGTASTCTLTNVTAATSVSAQFAPASAQAIPTLGEWAMLLLTGLMGLGAMVALRRR